MSPNEEEAERLDILDWLKETFNLDTTEDEIEIFGVSSSILQKIDKLVEVSDRFLMENSETRKNLAEIREYFAKFPRAVVAGDNPAEKTIDEVTGLSEKRRYNWIPAPKLEG